ncbi:hypothetical protein GCM10007940_30320 [Portibacter lacus]|uniref:MtN3 and saliva related transmembrane protein n=2 Tax=Portibacter lacus TaxID=1099794 RepID=A0AA37WE02_9BACT|nr:hypothetical protein GCM10007940_30320 [Portibacter lacus]
MHIAAQFESDLLFRVTPEIIRVYVPLFSWFEKSQKIATNMSYITLIGIVAAIITTTSFLPQVIKIYKTKNTKDISLSMYYLITSGIILWLVYGILVKDLPIIIANGVTFILVCSILVMKLKYK